MLIVTMLRSKGSSVVTVPPETPVGGLLGTLAEHRIGAVVVSTDRRAIEGIVSERDVVRQLRTVGAPLLDQPVSAIMTRDVVTCVPQSTVEDVMRLMTDQRIRHVPVVLDDALVGIVSIGDVVKTRIYELERERDDLVGYIGTR
jgi:CBS domain-containing protein